MGMGKGCAEKSEELAKYYADVAQRNGCRFLDANGYQFNSVDYMHLTRQGHAQLADKLAKLVPELL
jgi:lysophospholipase L1-like esterase